MSYVDDFLLAEQSQDGLTKKNYEYMKHYKVLSMIGLVVEGLKADFPITLSGILAAAHKEGGLGTAKYLKALEKNKKGKYYLPYDSYRGDTLRSFKAIETRLREFSNIGEN